jgi:hypothetical protein
MKHITLIIIISLSGCATKLSPEQTAAIDNNFTILASTIKGIDERVKALEDKTREQPSRSSK